MSNLHKFCIRKTHEEFISELQQKYENQYTVLDPYAGASKKINVRHELCGFINSITPSNLLTHGGCPKCSCKLKHTIEGFREKVKELTGSEYEVLEKNQIKNKYSKIHIKHITCGFEWHTTVKKFINQGYRCKQCAGNLKGDTDTFKESVLKAVGSEFSVLGDYTNIDGPLKIRHNVCGLEFDNTPFLFLKSPRCPACDTSIGEKRIAEVLSCKNIKFKKQFSFIDCKYKQTLPFDFAIFKNDLLSFLIEYDGIQHFKPTFGIDKFNYTSKTDAIKNDYCDQNKISLIRIPYTEYSNIEEIISVELTKQ